MPQVSVVGYHEHFVRRASAAQRRHLSEDALLVHIKAIHAQTHGGYGWPCTCPPSGTVRLRSAGRSRSDGSISPAISPTFC